MTRKGKYVHDGMHRCPGVVWGAGLLSIAVLLVSTLELSAFEHNLWLRALVMAAGAIPAIFVLAHLTRRGEINQDNRKKILLAVMIVHILATLYFFPLADIVNDKPVVTLDHSFHYYQAFRAREVFWETFRLDRYDPYFMAGYPGGTIFDMDMKGAETFCAFVPFGDVARLLKLFILCAYIALVPVIYRGSRLQGFGTEESMLGLVLFLAWWHWGRPYAGDFRYAGMFSFVFASHICFLLVGLLRQVARGRRVKTFLGLGPLVFLIHPTSVVMLPVPFAFSIGIDHKLWNYRRWFVLFVWCLCILVINSLWLRPFFEYLWMKTTTEAYYQIEGCGGLLNLLLKPTCLVALAMILLSIVGMAWMTVRRRLSIALPAAAGAISLFFAAGAGVYLPLLNQLEPGRFLFPAFVFLAPLAGSGLRFLLFRIASVFGGERRRRRFRVALYVALILVALPFAMLESKSFYRHTIRTSHIPRVESLIEEIVSVVVPTGRLMIEDCAAMHYGDSHLPGLLPLATDVEQIGGPYPHTFLLYHFAEFCGRNTFGRPMRQWDPESIRPYLELYDIRWVVTVTDSSGKLMRRLLDRQPAWTRPPYALWSLEPPTGWTDRQGLVVKAAINRLDVTGDAGSPGYFLEYHWAPGLKASGAARIRPVHRLDDPVPFIYIEPNGERNIKITY